MAPGGIGDYYTGKHVRLKSNMKVYFTCADEDVWWSLKDFWKRNLWDIEPLCQVVEVDDKDIVVFSGALGAPTRWNPSRPLTC